jgi:hypothetical protein
MIKKIINNKKITGPFVFFLLFISYGIMAQVGIATTTPLSTFEVNGSFGQTITTVSTDLTLDATHSIIVCNNGAISKTITLPTALGIKGRIYTIKRSDTSTASITIATTALQSIDGELNILLTRAKRSVSLISDGTNWKIIGIFAPEISVGEISYFNTIGTLVSLNSSTIDGSSNMFLCNPETTLSTNSIDFISSGNGRIQYKGAVSRTFNISATISGSTNSSGTFIYQLKNSRSGFLPSSRVVQKLNSEERNTTIQAIVTLTPNDFIELWIGKVGGTATVSIMSLNLFAIGL